MQTVPQVKNPGVAALLSFLISGLGQIYNGQIGKGLIIIVVQVINAALMAVVIGFVTAPIVFIWAIYDAYKTAEQINANAVANMARSGPMMVGYVPTITQAQGQAYMQGPPSQPFYGGAQAMPSQPLYTNSQPTPPSQPLAPGMKKCPACAEVVQGEAQRCRFCGHEFFPMPQ